MNVNINVNVNDSAGAGVDVDVVPPIASTLRISHRVHVKRQLITVSQLLATTKAEPKLQQLHNKELIPIVTGRHRPRAKHCVKIKESHNRANRTQWGGKGNYLQADGRNTLAKQVNHMRFKDINVILKAIAKRAANKPTLFN